MKAGVNAARAIVGLLLVYTVVFPLVAVAVTSAYLAFKIGGSED